MTSGIGSLFASSHSFLANSALSAALTFLSSSLHTHHFIISNRSTYQGQKPLFMKSFSLDRRAIRHCCTVCAGVCMTVIICVRLFERVGRPSACCMFTAQRRLDFHVTTHKFKRREEDEGEEKKRRNNSFFFFF